MAKLRRVGDILGALKEGSFLVYEGGLYRVLHTDGKLQPVSKRRSIAFIDKGVVRAVAGSTTKWELPPVAEKK